MNPRIRIIYSFAIYGGGHHLGDVAELATGQYAAFDPTGKRLGIFDHRADAERTAWNNTVVLCEQPSITIYVNPHGAAVIRQERAGDEDGDTYIVIQPQNARAVAAAIMQAAGIGEPVRRHTGRHHLGHTAERGKGQFEAHPDGNRHIGDGRAAGGADLEAAQEAQGR